MESGTGMCDGHDPLFSGQSALPSYQFTINGRLMCPPPPFSIFWKKNCIFNLVLVKILALKMQIFKIFVPKTPHFSRKIRSLDPTFGNLCGTHPPKKVECPPPRHFTKAKRQDCCNSSSYVPTWNKSSYIFDIIFDLNINRFTFTRSRAKKKKKDDAIIVNISEDTLPFMPTTFTLYKFWKDDSVSSLYYMNCQHRSTITYLIFILHFMTLY